MNDFYYWKREYLYAEVWEQPLTKVAEKYSVSDVAIGKLCRRLKVPLPGRGYWAKKEAGQSLKRTPLPAFKDPPVICYRRHEPSIKPQLDSTDPELAKIAEVESRTVHLPTVEHKLVTTARRVLERARTDEYDRAHHPPSSPCIDIQVSKEFIERALSIMNAILFALEAEGLQVKVSDQSTTVEVFGRTIAFGIEEALQANGKRESKRRFSTVMVTAYKRTGNLAFRVLNNATGVRAQWGDSNTKRLEGLLPKCIGGILRHARLLRIENEQRRQRELEWERQRLEQAERIRKAREEEERLLNLEKCIVNWQKAEQIRGYVDAYVKMCAEKGEPMISDSPKGQWIMWARRKADWFDPLKQ
jgi:hypothetical protein